MTERMSDERLAEIAKDAETYIYIPHPQGVCQELITALKADREADRAEVERLEKALASSCDDARKEIYGCCPGNKELALQAKVERLEARIDALMLEYCPDEMTAEQKANWAEHQVPA